MKEYPGLESPTETLYQYLLTKQIPGFQQTAKEVTVKKGAVLYDTSEPFTAIYEIKAGAVKLGSLSQKGEEYIYEIVKTGDIFGNIAFLPQRFSEFSKAIVPTTLYAYELEFFRHQVLNDSVAADKFIRCIIGRWHKTESMLSKIRYYEPRERILHLYDSMSEKVETSINRSVVLNKQLTKKDIADITATTRQLVADTLR